MTAVTRDAPRSRPILFSGAMVRAILDGSKTQTRRVVKPPRVATLHGRHSLPDRHFADSTADLPDGTPNRYLHWFYGGGDLGSDHCATRVFCPFGKPGDRLWVRETWCERFHESPHPEHGYWHGYHYAADGEQVVKVDGDGFQKFNQDGSEASPWKPSIHMPREASRLTLEVTDVRVERLQEISEEDARAEGIRLDAVRGTVNGEPATLHPFSYRQAFIWLWDSLAKPPATWADNPWVWVVGFRRVP